MFNRLSILCFGLIVVSLFFNTHELEAGANMSYSNDSEGGEVVISTNMDHYNDTMKIKSNGKNKIDFNRNTDGITRDISLIEGGSIETYSTPSMMPISISLNLIGERGSLVQDFRIVNLENEDAPYMKSDHKLQASGEKYQIISYLKDNFKGTSALLEVEGDGEGALVEEFEAWSKILSSFIYDSRPRFESGYSNYSNFSAEGTGTAYLNHSGINVDVANILKLNDTVFDLSARGREFHLEGISNW
ncbi:MAG: hypothetical protein ACOCQS_00785 [Bacillota bacterium]